MSAQHSTRGLYGLFIRAILYWLPIAAAITALSGLVYVVAQQTYRQSANDPQIQLAEDAAAQLEAGAQPQALAGSNKVDIAHSLAPFLIIYDDTGSPIASSAQLNGQTPPLPLGVFTDARKSGEDRITWQPQEGVRSATIITHFAGPHPGFVLSGRSLAETEHRIDQITPLVALAW
ncbi:MAG: hypothetical protein ABJA50_10615, partial [Chloroflexota bacterium]